MGRPRHESLAARNSAIAKAYARGERISALAERFGIGQTQLYRVLNAAHAARRQPEKANRGCPLTLEAETAIAAAYRAGASRQQLGERFRCSRSRIDRVLRDAGIRLRDPLASHARRYPVREHAFRAVTPESAYWAGLLMADGCVSRGRTVQLTLHRSDAAHLRLFHEFLGCPDRPVAIREQTAISAVHSTRLVGDLIAHGIVPRKSYGAQASDELARAPSFWLGMIDGDGSIFFSRGPTVSLCGSRPLMEQFQHFLATKVLGRRQRIAVREPDGLCSVTVQGRRAQALLQVLYKSSPVSLDRKREIAERALTWECAWPRDRVFSSDARQEWREKRAAWSGEGSARRWHVSALADAAHDFLIASGALQVSRLRPRSRSSMVAFHASFAEEAAIVWVTSRWRAEVPAQIRAQTAERAVFVLHLSPRLPEASLLKRVSGNRTSFVPVAHLRALAAGEATSTDQAGESRSHTASPDQVATVSRLAS